MKKILIIAALALLASSCTKDFERINQNPNKIQYGETSAHNCLEPLVYGLASRSQYQNWFFANELVQVTAFTSGKTSQIHQYQITDGQWQSQWDNNARYGNDANHMINLAKQKGDKYYEALGLILKVYELSELWSLYGDIPYDEAYMLSANTTPAFESTAELVNHFVRDLDSAAVILARKPVPYKSGLDRMYSDKTAQWIKFANSLKMRIYNRVSGMDPAYWTKIQAMIDAQAPVFGSNADNAAVPFQDADPYRSYWGTDNTTESIFTGHRICQTMIDMMVEFNAAGNSIFVDPRLPIMAKKKGNDWKGSRGGVMTDEFKAYDNGAAVPNFETLCRASMPAFLMDWSEVLFILAEGVQKGKLTVPGETAKSLYEAAVRASIEKWSSFGQYASSPITVRSSDVNKLLTGVLGSYDLAVAGTGKYSGAEELIACQKFISLYFCSYEPYNEWRRTEYPYFEIADGTVANGYELPTRFGYPNYTVASNRNNVNSALTRMGGANASNNMHLALDWSYAALNGGHRKPHANQSAN